MAGTPLHFGDSDRILYGVFHDAEKRVSRAHAALLFNPFGEEAIRASRIFKVLADRLARNGVATLRFDYFGTGDSGGEDGDVTLAGMADDSAHAQDELEALSGARSFIWIGLGLGGASALQIAATLRPRLGQLFLWDPVLKGADYLSDLHHAHAAFLAYALDQPIESVRRTLPTYPGDLREAIGFEISQRLSDELVSLDLSCVVPRTEELHVIHAAGYNADDSFIAAQEAAGARLHQFIEEAASWNSNEALNSYYVPGASIDYILGAVKKRL